MFRKECWSRVRSGFYCYKNNIKVYKPSANSCWVVKTSAGIIEFEGRTLSDCKCYLGKEYN